MEPVTFSVPRTDNKYFGKVHYDAQGKPVCHLCGRSFNVLLLHVRRVHKLAPKEYKKMFGLSPKKSILSQRTKKNLQAATTEAKKKNLHNRKPFTPGSGGNPLPTWSAEGRANVQKANQKRSKSSDSSS